MATDLTTPISHGDTATSQVADDIIISLSENSFSFNVVDKNADGDVLHKERYTFPIWDESEAVILPASIETEAKDLHRAVTTAAKNAGYIGDGTTTDDI